MRKTTNHEKKHLNPRKAFSRSILQILVWMLVIAFISTIGVMWDGNVGAYPIVVSTDQATIDLAPRGLYMLEYDRLDTELKERNLDIDPRLYYRYLEKTALTNTKDAATREAFYSDIDVTPSIATLQELQAQTGMSSNVIAFQYADAYFLRPLGVISTLSVPTISDMYAFNDLSGLQIASEILVLNHTNFLFTKVNDEELEQYYLDNITEWLNTITVQEFKSENRGQARRLATVLKEKGITEGIAFLQTNEMWTNKVTMEFDKTITANGGNFNYFLEILKIHQNRAIDTEFTVSEPIYNQGNYYVATVEGVANYAALEPAIQQEILREYLGKNFDKLAKKYQKEWGTIKTLFKEKIATDTSFTTVVAEVQGSINHVTQPFTLVQSSVSNVFGGTELNIPIFSNKDILSALLNTPEMEQSDLIEMKDILMVVRPFQRSYSATNPEDIVTNQALYQQVGQFKTTKLVDGMISPAMEKRYNVKTYPESLTNLNIS